MKCMTFCGGTDGDCASKSKTNSYFDLLTKYIKKGFAGEWQYACPIYRMPGA